MATVDRTKMRADSAFDQPKAEEFYGKSGRIRDRKTPATAQTVRGRDRLKKGVDVADATKEQRRLIAGDFLTRARDDYEQATRNRIRYIRLAREYGMTLEAIGGLLGVTEAAVRQMLKRHGGDN